MDKLEKLPDEKADERRKNLIYWEKITGRKTINPVIRAKDYRTKSIFINIKLNTCFYIKEVMGHHDSEF
ncbi:hypothetical protein CANFE03_11400 [Ligilactobacillus animalis]